MGEGKGIDVNWLCHDSTCRRSNLIPNKMNKRQTNWDLLDFLLLTVSLLAGAQQLTALWTITRQASLLGGSATGVASIMTLVAIITLSLLVLVLRKFDGLLERVVGVVCVWGIWYFSLSMATFLNMLQLAQRAVE